MVAGMSSRFGGKPKQLEKVGPNEETLIEYSVKQALQSPFQHLYFITNPKTEHRFREIFSSSYQSIPITYIPQIYDTTQREKPWGTSDAIANLVPYVQDAPCLIVNGDDIYGEDTFRKAYQYIQKYPQDNIIGVLPLHRTLPKTGKVNRGIVNISTTTTTTTITPKVTSLEEMLNISIEQSEYHNMYANVNCISLQPSTINYIASIVKTFKNAHKSNPKIECLLPNDLSTLIQENKITMYAFEMDEDIIGITNPGDEIQLRKHLSINAHIKNKI